MSASILGPLFLAALSTVANPAPQPTVANPAPQPAASPAASPLERPSDAEALFQRLNRERSNVGVCLLALDRRLITAARQHALDMLARHYFAHVAPDGVSPFDRMREAGVDYGYAGENLAMDVSPEAAHVELLDSPPHRENMLEPHYRHVGIAAVVSAEGEEIFVEDFSD